jgi:hypothetical protein
MKEHKIAFKELLKLFSDKGKWFTKEELEAAVEMHPLNGFGGGANHGTGKAFTATADFVFKCRTCEEVSMENPWYQIILGTIGGSWIHHNSSDESELSDGFNDSNIRKISTEDKTDYFTSGLHHVKGGYACDHCYDTVYNDN